MRAPRFAGALGCGCTHSFAWAIYLLHHLVDVRLALLYGLHVQTSPRDLVVPHAGHDDTAHAVWQWGDDPGYKNFVIGLPADRRGAVVFTNGDAGAAVYSELVRYLFPGQHPALDVWLRSSWIDSWTMRATST